MLSAQQPSVKTKPSRQTAVGWCAPQRAILQHAKPIPPGCAPLPATKKRFYRMAFIPILQIQATKPVPSKPLSPAGERGLGWGLSVAAKSRIGITGRFTGNLPTLRH